MQVRRARMKDIIEMQNCNLRCLPENYNLRYYYYHYLSWPQDLFVLEDVNNQIAGYVLAKVDDDDDAKKKHGHITSLAVLRSHRKLGAASALMRSSMQEMREVDDANFCSLHVRKTNAAALHLYQDTLKFRCVDIEEKYYVDDEDAFHMKRFFKKPGAEVGKEKQVKIAYVTPHGDMKWTKLDSEQLRAMNADIPNFEIPGEPNVSSSSNAAQAASSKNNAGSSDKKDGAKNDDENNNNKQNNNNKKGGNKKGGNNNQATDADIEAQLAALGEGGKGNKSKAAESGGNKKKGKK